MIPLQRTNIYTALNAFIPKTVCLDEGKRGIVIAMSKATRSAPDSRSATHRANPKGLAERLTPSERRALWLVAGLFVLGTLVRGCRLGQF